MEIISKDEVKKIADSVNKEEESVLLENVMKKIIEMAEKGAYYCVFPLYEFTFHTQETLKEKGYGVERKNDCWLVRWN